MKSITLPLTLSLMIVSLVIGVMGGYFLTPRYQQTMYEKSDMGFGAADRFVDLRYINAMIAHHRGALILASQIADKTTREEIKQLVFEIQSSEPNLIDELYSWKKAWYKDNSAVADPVVANLGSADDKVDLRFLNALIAHHEAGIVMAREIRTKSMRNEILNNADSVEQFLTNGVDKLKNMREVMFGVK